MPVSARLVSLRLDGRYIETRAAPAVIRQETTATVTRGVRRMRDPMERGLQNVYASLKKRHERRWPRTGLFGGDRGSPDLFARSGKGLRSIRDSISVRLNGQMGVVGSIDTGTMGVHETGATITPRGRFLLIPTVFALTSRGNKRVTPGKARNTFFRLTKAGNLFLFRRVKGDRPVPLFLLRGMVGLRARLGLKEAVERMADAFPERAAQAFKAGIR
jgi:hypothetical protein